MNKPDIPDPEDYSEKEVYAFFGLASYMAQVLERGIQIYIVGLKLSEHKIISSNIIDNLLKEMEQKTLGKLILLLKNRNELSDTEFERMDSMLNKRNWLTHYYMYENIDKFVSENGRKLLIEELIAYIKDFQDTDYWVQGKSRTLWDVHGFTEDIIEKIMNDIKQTAINKYDAI